MIARIKFLVNRQCIISVLRFKSIGSLSPEQFKRFDAHWPRSFINRMLNSDLLVEGRLCYTSPNSAYVVNPSDGNRILIYSRGLNRALPNDIVAVKLNRIDQWRVRAFLEDKEDRFYRSSSSSSSSTIIPAEAEEFPDECVEDEVDSPTTSIVPNFQLTSGRPSSVMGIGLFPSVREVLRTSPALLPSLFPGANLSSNLLDLEPKPLTPLPSNHLIRTGRVVGILGEDSSSRRLIGHLTFESAILMPSAFAEAEAESVDEFSRPRQGVVEGMDGLPLAVPSVVCFFIPEKSNVPKVKLAPSSIPNDLWENPHKTEGVRYLCKVQDWSATSSYPHGVLCGEIGNPLDIEPATQEILISHGIHEDEFTPEMLKDLPATEADFQIPNYEYIRRRDFRSHCVVSVDPSTAKDLDDALHVKMLNKDSYEVGIHIADVSFFVRPFTALDREASNRTTSTYLVQRVIPMLPAILSEHLCSLNPGVDRLAFSVVFKVDSHANILDVWFGRTVIRSCARLSYEDADDLLETPFSSLKTKLAPRIPVQAPFTLSNVKRSVGYLDMLAQQMRKRRIDNGALLLDKIQLQFDLTPKANPNTESSNTKEALSIKEGWPRGYSIKERSRAHHLIEEWMLAANQAVARHLFYHVIRQKHRQIILSAHTDTDGGDGGGGGDVVDPVTTLGGSGFAMRDLITAAVGARQGREPERADRRGAGRGFPPSSAGTVLRRHPEPKVERMDELVKIANAAGIQMDTSSAGAMRASIDGYIASLREKGMPEDQVESLSTALSYLTYMRMQMALYFSVEDIVDRAIRKVRGGDSDSNRLSKSSTEEHDDDQRLMSSLRHESWESALLRYSHHFGLNAPLYTHFTSPIRRYADLLVHRQLADLLGCGHWCYPRSGGNRMAADGGPPSAVAPRRLTVQAAWCNRMRRETRRAQEESQQLFLAAWIKSTGSMRENAVVLDVGIQKIQLLIPSCGLVLNHQLQVFCKEASSWCVDTPDSVDARKVSEGADNEVKRDEITPKGPSVTVKWDSDGEQSDNRSETTSTKLSVLTVCPVRLTCSSRGFYVKAELLPPSGGNGTASGEECTAESVC